MLCQGCQLCKPDRHPAARLKEFALDEAQRGLLPKVAGSLPVACLGGCRAPWDAAPDGPVLASTMEEAQEMDEIGTGRRWDRLRVMLAGAVLAGATLVASAMPAHADPYVTMSCSTGGFTGTVRVEYIRQSSGREYIPRVSYKIDKGGNSGGNKADVFFSDGGTLPAIHFSTPNGVQNSQWQQLSGMTYTRGNGYTQASFVFDKSWVPDPQCTTSARYW
jgi:hypothetical protein